MTVFLANPAQVLQVTDACDTLCQACPNNRDGLCRDEAKVALFDQRTLSHIGRFAQADQLIALHELCQIVYDGILQNGLLAEVCGECEWAALCQDKWQRGDFNRHLILTNIGLMEPL
jgi:hypothetical protein